MATYYTLLTKIGQARIANAVALNQMVNLTYMAVGDGNGNPTTPNENQTALVREKYRATINQLTVDPDNPNYLVAELIIPTNVGGWSIYEVGVFDDQNQLIAVANFPATYKPELVEGSGRDLIVRIIIQVSNTSVVTLKIDPAITLASQAWVAANYVKKITVAGGTTGQILAKKSNANEDFQWVDPTAAVDVNVFSREETQTVATGQTIINLAQLTTDGAAIYIEGIRLRDDQFTVNSPTRLTLAASYQEGTKVTIVQNEETSRNAFTLKANNLSDLTDKSAAIENLGLGEAAKRGVGTGSNQLPDMSAFGMSRNGQTAWDILPNGMIRQVGTVELAPVGNFNAHELGGVTYYTHYYRVNFPRQFPNAQIATLATLASYSFSTQSTMAGKSLATHRDTDSGTDVSRTRFTVTYTTPNLGEVPTLHFESIGY